VIGRYLYGAAAILSGVAGVAFHSLAALQQIKALGTFAAQHHSLVYIVAAVEILGGIAVLWPGTVRAGSATLVALFGLFALLAIPYIVEHPFSGYNPYGNFFEQLSLGTGAAIVYAYSGPVTSRQTPLLARIAYYAFGACVVSFGLEQAFYLAPTAGLVPKWIPPGQTFWAIATTVALFLGGLGLITGLASRLASILTTAMLLGFGLLVWVPILFEDPHTFANWSEATETFLIAACAWVVADYLNRRSSVRI
jgi:uncharacterized membrane protein YphA (DoxX/SURF4 family)